MSEPETEVTFNLEKVNMDTTNIPGNVAQKQKTWM